MLAGVVAVFFEVPAAGLLGPEVLGGFDPGRGLAGVVFTAELAEEDVESFEGDLTPADLEGEGEELFPVVGAEVGLLGVLGARHRQGVQ